MNFAMSIVLNLCGRFRSTPCAWSVLCCVEDDVLGLDLVVVVQEVEPGAGECGLLPAEVRLDRQHEQRVALVASAGEDVAPTRVVARPGGFEQIDAGVFP